MNRAGPAVRGRRAFTLVEMLLALSLFALLMTALNFVVFSMAEAWGRGREERLFAQHARAVTRHLDGMLHAALRQAVASGQGEGALSPVAVKLPGGGEANLVTFILPAGDRLLPWPAGAALPDVACSLAAEKGKGLVLYWRSRIELDYGEEPPRELVVSPYVTSCTYDYLDTSLGSWTNEPEIKKDTSGQPLAPNRLRLKFTRGKQDIETVIVMPVTGEGLPPF